VSRPCDAALACQPIRGVRVRARAIREPRRNVGPTDGDQLSAATGAVRIALGGARSLPISLRPSCTNTVLSRSKGESFSVVELFDTHFDVPEEHEVEECLLFAVEVGTDWATARGWLVQHGLPACCSRFDYRQTSRSPADPGSRPQLPAFRAKSDSERGDQRRCHGL